MKQTDLCTILCNLTCKYYDFASENHSLVYEFSGRKYRINFQRLNGEFKSFTAEDIGPGEVETCEK